MQEEEETDPRVTRSRIMLAACAALVMLATLSCGALVSLERHRLAALVEPNPSERRTVRLLCADRDDCAVLVHRGRERADAAIIHFELAADGARRRNTAYVDGRLLLLRELRQDALTLPLSRAPNSILHCTLGGVRYTVICHSRYTFRHRHLAVRQDEATLRLLTLAAALAQEADAALTLSGAGR